MPAASHTPTLTLPLPPPAVRECQARWRVLRDKFAREMRKNVNAKKAGGSALQVYQGSWALMSHLMFLTSHVRHRTAQG